MTYRYVAIGDSQSEGVGDTPWPDGMPRGWADRLAGLLAARVGDLDYANLAVRGLKAAQIRDTQLEPALRLGPDLVTITAGVNDLLRPKLDLAALRDALDELIAAPRARNAAVIVVPAPDIAGLMPIGGLVAPRVAQFNELLAGLAERHGAACPPVPAPSVFSDVRSWSPDRLHLSPAGHDRLARAAMHALYPDAEADWNQPWPTPAPPRTFTGDLRWWWTFGRPWLVRRVRGRSSADGRYAKRPELGRYEPRTVEP